MAAWWALHLAGRTWRGWIRHRVEHEIRDVARRLGGRVEPRWLGWRVRAPDVEVSWVGGVAGERTDVRRGGQERSVPGLLGADAVAASLDGLATGPATPG